MMRSHLSRLAKSSAARSSAALPINPGRITVKAIEPSATAGYLKAGVLITGLFALYPRSKPREFERKVDVGISNIQQGLDDMSPPKIAVAETPATVADAYCRAQDADYKSSWRWYAPQAQLSLPTYSLVQGVGEIQKFYAKGKSAYTPTWAEWVNCGDEAARAGTVGYGGYNLQLRQTIKVDEQGLITHNTVSYKSPW